MRHNTIFHCMGHHERGHTALQFGVSVNVLHCPRSLIDPLYLFSNLSTWKELSLGYSMIPFSLFSKTEKRLLLIFETLFQGPDLYLGYVAKVYSAFSMCRGLELLSLLKSCFSSSLFSFLFCLLSSPLSFLVFLFLGLPYLSHPVLSSPFFTSSFLLLFF